jgi:hypothetical protein
MQLAPTKWTSGALVLIFASLLLYVYVVVAERNARMPGHREEEPHADVGREPHTEAGERAQTEMVERAVTPFGMDTEGGETQTETGEHGETLFGIDLDSPFIVTAAITVWSLIALGLVWQARWALAGGIGWAALSVLGDAFELLGKASEASWGLAAAALAVGVIHVGVAYMCFRAVRQAS